MKYGYARVSTEDQSLQQQIYELRKHCDYIYQEKASGAKDNREQLLEMLSNLKKGDEVIVWRLDRLGRSLSRLVELQEEFKEKGVKFRSITEPHLDTSSAQGRLVINIFSSLAEHEREIIRERILEGIEQARREGKHLGRKRILNKEQIKVAQELREQGKTVRSICKIIGCSEPTYYRRVHPYLEKNRYKNRYNFR